ncbi:MAG TPA: universal stress protein [Myxococcota bacterium]|nr:universal stress protein [Myxococcota bacterium]
MSSHGSSTPSHFRTLGPLLCWAIVYADIGTSIYYVPGILYREVGASSATFVLATSLAFVLLSEKYSEIAARYPGGGGVVSVAEEAFGARIGALGGMLILVDYFLTAAISAVSGFTYLASLVPVLHGLEPWLAAAGLLLLGVLNWVGIRESAQVSAAIGTAAFLGLLALIGITATHLDVPQWTRIGSAVSAAGAIPLSDAVVGYAAAWLAFSGLESLAQISPAMRPPRRRTGGVAMLLVVIAVLVTSPILTAFATNVLDASRANPDAFQSELAAAVGGEGLRIVIVLTASALLLFAANTAIVGAYHVFGALADGDFLPRALLERHPRFGTPWIAIIAAVVMPLVVITATRGDIGMLGELYAFGLLGAFVLSSTALDRVRIHEGRTGMLFAVGVATSLLVIVAFLTNLFEKPHATLFGGSLTIVMLAYGLVHRGEISLGRRQKGPAVTTEEAERLAAEKPAAARILTLKEAQELRPTYAPHTLVCLRGPNQRLLEEAEMRLRGARQTDVAVLFVDEVPGLFVPRDTEPSREATEVLEAAVNHLEEQGFTAVPIWRLAQDTGEAIAYVAKGLGCDAILVGTSQRGALWHILRGNVLSRLIATAPRETRILIVG